MKRFILAPAAARDIDAIWEYIARDRLKAADREVAKFYQAFSRLASAPGIGHTRTDLAENRSLLFWPVGSYLVIYRLTRKRVEIVAVAHGKLDIPALIRRRAL